MKKSILLLLIILILVSCADKAKVILIEKKPLWMGNKNLLYPNDLYLSALGNGDSYQEAQNLARANISRIFKSDINSVSQLSQKYVEVLKKKTFENMETTTQDKSVTVKSKQNLMNIKFGENYTDKTGIIHTVAYINRKETGKIYEQKIFENSNNINIFLDKANSTRDLIEKYAYYKAAYAYASINKILIDQLMIISPKDGQTTLVSYSYGEISSNLKSIGKQITFEATIKNDKNDKIKDIIGDIFSDLGFSGGQNALLKIDGRVDFEEVDLGYEDKKFIGWELSLKLVQTDIGTSIFSTSDIGREGGTDLKRAQQTTYYQIRKRMKSVIVSRIEKYFDSKM